MRDKEARGEIEVLRKDLEKEREYRLEVAEDLRELKEKVGRLGVRFCKNCKHNTPHLESPSGLYLKDGLWVIRGGADILTCLVCGKMWEYECKKIAKEVK